MKRFTILAAAISLLISLALPIAVAAPSLGSKCNREGEVAHMSQLLICAKVGKVLKYVAATPDAIGAPSRPSAVVPAKNVDPTVLKAFTSFNHSACTQPHQHIVMTYLTSPNYSQNMVDGQKALLEKAASCYDAYFDRQININVVMATEKDYDFLAAQKTNGQPVFDDIRLRWLKFMTGRITPVQGKLGGTFAGSAGWNPATDSGWLILLDATANKTPDPHVASHEFVHVLQSFSKSVFFPNYGDGSSEVDYVNMPPWFWEGTAELFSYDSISSQPGYLTLYMAETRMQGRQGPNQNKISTPAALVTTMQELKSSPNGQSNMLSYALGSQVCEYILATYGYSKYWQIMKNAGQFKNFDENIKSAIGLTQDELFLKSAPFVLSQWKLS